jgi:hypothetical protein
MTPLRCEPGYVCVEGGVANSHRIAFESAWIVRIGGKPYRVGPGWHDLALLVLQHFQLHGWNVYVSDPTQTTVSRRWVAQAGLEITPVGPTPGILPAS